VPKAGTTDDFTLANSDGRNKYGLMAMRGRNGRVFSIEDAQTILNRQLSMGEITEAELPASIEQVWSADDWSLGIGGVVHRKDPRKVASSKKVDTSEPGVIRLARALRTSTLDSAPNNYEPSGFALAPYDTGGASALNPELWAFVGRDLYSGGDDDWTLETEPQAVDVYYQNGVQFDRWVVATARYGGTDAPDVAMVYIYKDPSLANWVLSTSTSGRFKYMVVARNGVGDPVLWGANHIFDTGLTLSGAHNNSTTTIICSADPTATIAVNDILIVGAAGSQERMLVTAVTNPNLTVVRAYGDTAVSYAGADKIYLYQPHVLKNSVDPTNSGSWATATTIGEDDQPITGLAVDGDSPTLFIAKTDGIYSHGFDANGDVVTSNLTPEFRQFGHTGNFHGIYTWNGHVLLPVGTGGLLDMDIASGVIRDISLSLLAPEQTNLHGRVVALHGDPTNLFMLVKDTTDEKLHLVLAKLVSFNGETEFRYYVLQEMGTGGVIDLDQCTLMVDTSLSDHRRVWVGFTEAGVNETPHFYPFGRVGDDQTDGFTDDTDAEIITVEFDKNLPNVPMHVSKIELGTKNLLSGVRQIAVDHRFDREVDASGNEVWTTGPIFNQSPLQELDIPHGSGAKLMELRLRPYLSSVGAIGPEVTSVRVTWQIQPNPRKLIPMRVYLADGQLKLNGSVGGRPQKTLAQLNVWNEEPNDLVLGTPNKDDDRRVLFLPGSLKVKELHLEAGRRPEYEASFTLVEVS
jgi:hypothetical protein